MKSSQVTKRITFTEKNGDSLAANKVHKEGKLNIQITAPNMKTAVFEIVGTAPLVVHRIARSVEEGFHTKIVTGTTPRGKKHFEAKDPNQICEEAKYIGETNGERWEGFNASGIRKALISACRLTNTKMTLAKLCVFVLADGQDVDCKFYPLIRINGKSEKTEMIARTETGVAMLTIRPMYWPWSATLRIRFDAGQFSITDITNLLARAGQQVGICEGRPDSKNSAGMGWGTFEIKSHDDEKPEN